MLSGADKREIYSIMREYRSVKKGVKRPDLYHKMFAYVERLIHETHDTIT